MLSRALNNIYFSLIYIYADTLWLSLSGKSTLLLTLLRVIDLKYGAIRVDGVDLTLIPRTLIRQKCFITVSQDPFLIAQASLRFNLDVRGIWHVSASAEYRY